MEKEIHIFKILEDLNNIKLYIFIISFLVFLITYFSSINFFDQLKVSINIEQKKNIGTFDKINNLSSKIYSYELALNEIDFRDYVEYQNFKLTDTSVFTGKILDETFDLVLDKSSVSNFYNSDKESFFEVTEMNSFINKFVFKLEKENNTINVNFSSHKSQVENDINFLDNVVSIANENIKSRFDKMMEKYLYDAQSNITILSTNYKIANEVKNQERKKFIEELRTQYEIAKSLNLSEPADLLKEPDIVVSENEKNKVLRKKSYSYFDGYVALNILIENEEKKLNQESSFDVFLSNSEHVKESLLEIKNIYDEESSEIDNIFYLDKSTLNFEENQTRLIFSILFSLSSILLIAFYITVKNAYVSYKARS